MEKSKRVAKTAMAFMGIFSGAGFASGQEVMQYFTSHGWMGVVGTGIATILLGFIGLILVELGNHSSATTHTDVLDEITSPFLNHLIDIFITITLFILGVVMIAGAGANFNQQFNVPVWIGSTVLAVLLLLFERFDSRKIILILSIITPIILVFVRLLSAYVLIFEDYSFQALDPTAKELTPIIHQWLISSINYVGVNIALGASMAFIIGGEADSKNASILGGFFGGIGVGLIILLNNLALFVSVDEVSQSQLPILAIANNIHPVVGLFTSIIMFILMCSTAVSVFYSFTVRLSKSNTKNSFNILLVSVVGAFVLSFLGFKSLIKCVYPIIGYAGIFLIFILIGGWVRKRKSD